jgi:hypothetical protein
MTTHHWPRILPALQIGGAIALLVNTCLNNTWNHQSTFRLGSGKRKTLRKVRLVAVADTTAYKSSQVSITSLFFLSRTLKLTTDSNRYDSD